MCIRDSIFSDRVSTTATAGSSIPNFREMRTPDDSYSRRRSMHARAKSSEMLSVAGPFLSAEDALAGGYWEAEKEQLAADEALKARKDEDKKGDMGWAADAVKEHEKNDM